MAGIAASQPGKGCVSFRNRNAPSISAIPSPAPMFAILSRRIGHRLEPKDLTVGDERAEREFPSARPGKVKRGDRVNRSEEHAERERGDERDQNDDNDEPPLEA